MVGVPGFLARFLTRFLARFLTRVFGQGLGDRKYSFTVLQGRKNTVLQFYRDGENLEKNHIIKNPILLKIPYIKNLAVGPPAPGILDPRAPNPRPLALRILDPRPANPRPPAPES